MTPFPPTPIKPPEVPRDFDAFGCFAGAVFVALVLFVACVLAFPIFR